MDKKKSSVAKRRKNGHGKVFGKRRFRGKPSMSNNTPSEAILTTPMSASGKKINTRYQLNSSKSNNNLTPTNQNENQTMSSSTTPINTANVHIPSSCYLFINTNIITQIINLLATCPDCDTRNIFINFDISNKRGLSVPMKFNCTDCGWFQTFYTSEECKRQTCGRAPFDINARSVIAMREIGKGHSALEKLCGYLNMPPPMTAAVFNDIQKIVFDSYTDVATNSMKNAANELIESEFVFTDDSGIANVTVSCDGSWQKRGFSSLNVVTVIASDTENVSITVFAQYQVCKMCSLWESTSNCI